MSLGTCILKAAGGYNCRCKDGSLRENCRQHACDLDICGKYGACQKLNGTSYLCDCIPGYVKLINKT
jgi:hypothetical protein